MKKTIRKGWASLAWAAAATATLGLGDAGMQSAWADDTPHPEGHHHQIPPEAFAACTSKAAADACTVQIHDHTIDGTCQANQESKLFCRPNHPPPRPPQGN